MSLYVKNKLIILVSQNVAGFFNKDVIIIKPLMIAVLLMKIAFLGRECLLENGRSCTSKTSWVGGGGEGSPPLLATSLATNNKYPANRNLSDNPEAAQEYHQSLTFNTMLDCLITELESSEHYSAVLYKCIHQRMD